jgi:L(+)-tartrate dehydratase alpha subunit
MIRKDTLHDVAYELTRRAAIEIPADYLSGLEAMAAQESEDLSSFVLRAMLDNYKAAEEDARAMCADTGVPRFFVKAGNDAKVEGGMIAVEEALRSGLAKGTQDIPLRPNRVHPLWRHDNNNNVGINAPEIEYTFEPDADWLDITTVHKGGLFGTDYRMLFPGDGIDGIKRFFLDAMIAFGKRGLACQPAIVGIGLGGSKDTCMVLGKQAACLRTVGDRNPDPKIAELELELMDMGNNIGMGPMGFVGSSMVVDCHIEVGYTHTGGMPMSVHCFCLSSRRAVARLYPDGRVQYRTDPDWFTPYHRRNDVKWQPEAAKQSA